jgi:hypothetical protein
MARIRTVKPEFWSSEQVMACAPISRLLFIGIWNFADDAGRIADSAKSIKAQIFPGDDHVYAESVRGMIDELAGNGLLMKYEVDGKGYLQITGWKHQRIDKPQPPKHPAPNSTNETGALATDLILSNPKGAYLSGDAALARSPSGEHRAAASNIATTRLVGKRPSEMTRLELDAQIAAKRAATS